MQDISVLSLTAKNEIAGYIKRDNLEHVNELVTALPPKKTFYIRYGKRFIDIILALFMLIITFPINLIIAVATFFDVGKPIIFKQSRLGRDQKKFTIYKFRNMTNDTDAKGELLPPSERVTKWGRFVRKTSLDELLNFVSILTGSMSVIGPRPLLDHYADRFNDYHKMMYQVKPGLECPTLKAVDHALSWEERFDNYAWYAQNCSLSVDIKLFLRMFALVFNKKSTEIRSNANQGGFLGYDHDGKVIYTKSVPDKYVQEFCRNHGYASLADAIDDRSVVKV